MSNRRIVPNSTTGWVVRKRSIEMTRYFGDPVPDLPELETSGGPVTRAKYLKRGYTVNGQFQEVTDVVGNDSTFRTKRDAERAMRLQEVIEDSDQFLWDGAYIGGYTGWEVVPISEIDKCDVWISLEPTPAPAPIANSPRGWGIGLHTA